MDKIIMGNRVKDLVTGFEGIVTGEVKYMNGCEKWAIDGKWISDKQQTDGLWADKGQVVKIDDGIIESLTKKDTLSGGPMRTPPRG